jgi:hypothetical protein
MRRLVARGKLANQAGYSVEQRVVTSGPLKQGCVVSLQRRARVCVWYVKLKINAKKVYSTAYIVVNFSEIEINNYVEHLLRANTSCL